MALQNHSVNTLGGVALPVGVHWENGDDYAETGQTLIRMLSGGITNIEQANNNIGRPITLLIRRPACYFTAAQVAAIKALAAVEEQTYTLAWGTYSGSWSATNYTVIFDKSSGAAVSFTLERDDRLRLLDVASEGNPAQIYTGQINLLQVA